MWSESDLCSCEATLKQLQRKPRIKTEVSRDLNPWPPSMIVLVQCSTNWDIKPHLKQVKIGHDFWINLNFMIPPTVGRHVTNTLPTHYRHTCPTFSFFFTIIHMANLPIELLNNHLGTSFLLDGRLWNVPFICLNFRISVCHTQLHGGNSVHTWVRAHSIKCLLT